MLIRVIPVGDVPKKVTDAIVGTLEQVFHAQARLLSPLPVPQNTFNHWRKQYNGEQMMNILSQDEQGRFIDKDVPALFVTDVDIYYKGMSFVFGLENPAISTALISIYRLKPEFYDNSPNLFTLSERAAKEAVHEIGHHLGLEHCRHPFCVMCFSPSVADVDNKKKYFCSNCNLKLSMKGHDVE